MPVKTTERFKIPSHKTVEKLIVSNFNYTSLIRTINFIFQIIPQNNRRLRAIELSVPNVIATFQVKHRNPDGIIVDSRVYNIDLNSGKFINEASRGW